MTSVNYGTNPAPIGPPDSNSRSSSTASSAASAAAALASQTVGNANGVFNNIPNGISNGTSNGLSNGLSNGHSSNSPPVGTPSPMAMPFGPNGDLSGASANGVNGLRGSPQFTTVLVRRVVLGYNTKALSHISTFCNQGLIHSEAIDPDVSKDAGYMGALLQYDSRHCAAVAIDKLNGMRNISFDSKMSAEFLGPDQSPFAPATTGSFTSPVLSLDTAISRPIQSAGLLSQPAGPFANSTFQIGSHPVTSSIVHEAFSRPPPIGNHLTDRGVRTSSLDLINSGSGNDDPLDLTFGSLSLNENSSLDNAPSVTGSMSDASRPQLATQRRSTMPQVPTMHNFSSLRLDTTNVDPSNGVRSSGYPTPSYGQSPALYSAHPSHSAHPTHNMGTLSAGGMNGNASFHTQRRGPHHHQPHGRHMVPHVNPGDQHPPCNTLYVGNIPMDAKESELKALFSTQRGYKRLSLRTRNNNTMCFVEFEDVTTATKALDELYGRPLSNSNHRGGMRLSYSKNPFGVRSEHNPNNRTNASAVMHGMSQSMYSHNQVPGANALGGAPPPPPGLPVPPSLNATTLPLRSDGLVSNVGAQIPPSAYAQLSPWNQPQQVQQAQQVQSTQSPYGVQVTPGYQGYEEDDDGFSTGSLYGVMRSTATPNSNYAFQGNGVSSAFSRNAGYNPAYGSNTNSLTNAGMNGVGGGVFAPMRNPSLNSANGSNASAAGRAQNGVPNSRAAYNDTSSLTGPSDNGQSHMSYQPFN